MIQPGQKVRTKVIMQSSARHHPLLYINFGPNTGSAGQILQGCMELCLAKEMVEVGSQFMFCSKYCQIFSDQFYLAEYER